MSDSKLQLTLPGDGAMGGEIYFERASDSFAVNLNGQLMFLELQRAGQLRDYLNAHLPVEAPQKVQASNLCVTKLDPGICTLCNERTDQFAGDPGLWPLEFAHPDGTGYVRSHHVKCVQARLFPTHSETSAPQAPIAKVIVRESGAGHYAPDDISVPLYAPGLPPGEHDLYCVPTKAEPCGACIEAHAQIPSSLGIPDGDIADRVGDLVERIELLWTERDELKETLAHLAHGGVTGETTCARCNGTQIVRDPETNCGGPCPDCPPTDEYESVGWQYKFPSIWGGAVWRDSPSRHNGSDYTESREVFAKRSPLKAPAPRCATHGVELAFDGDECWECKREA